jgi:hypothetical protein
VSNLYTNEDGEPRYDEETPEQVEVECDDEGTPLMSLRDMYPEIPH